MASPNSVGNPECGTNAAVGLTFFVQLDPTPAPPVSPSLASCDANALCDFIYRETGVGWLAESGYYLLVKPFRILLIIVAALVLRYVVHRMIGRLTRSAGEGNHVGLLRPLRDRIPESLQDVTGMRSERRQQRAEALGSVLRSVVSVSIFSVAVMLVLGELGVQLAPLIASAGIAGVALGFGAQNLVKDFIAGLFMLLEDQYGVGDLVDVGEASGTVEAVGLRITTIRDARGVLWYIRNGEIVRVGNRSQGWALVVVDVPVGFAGVDEATAVLRSATDGLAEDPDFANDLLEPPQVLGVEQITVDGAVLRTTAKTLSAAQWRVARDLRRRLTDALESAGITAQITANRVFIRSPHPAPGADAPAPPPDPGVGGPT
jgi:small-conductance mechanosensitive channel